MKKVLLSLLACFGWVSWSAAATKPNMLLKMSGGVTKKSTTRPK